MTVISGLMSVDNGRGILIRLGGKVPVVSRGEVVPKLEAFLDET